MTETTMTLPVAATCEHCGSADIFIEREDLSAYQARCNDCGSRGPIVEEGQYYDDEEAGQRDATIAWNRRAAPSSLTPDEREYLLSRVTSELAEFSGDQRHMTRHESERADMLRGLADKLRGGAAVAPVAAQGWKPMGSAPDDGRLFLAAVLVRHNETKEEWWEQHIIARDDETGDVHNDHYQGWDWGDYSYWMPLPAAPGAQPAQPDAEERGVTEAAKRIAGVFYRSAFPETDLSDEEIWAAKAADDQVAYLSAARASAPAAPEVVDYTQVIAAARRIVGSKVDPRIGGRLILEADVLALEAALRSAGECK